LPGGGLAELDVAAEQLTAMIGVSTGRNVWPPASMLITMELS
jgi:hypothetical protein